jgi:PAS domain S-box-containing protein
MTLRRKTLLIICTALGALIAVLYSVSSTILMGDYADLEQQNTHKNVERVLDALANELANLDMKASDWAVWDDTYAFIENANPAYIQSNLTDTALVDLKVNTMLFFNTANRVVFGKAVDLASEKEVPVPPSIHAHLSADSLLLKHSDLESAHHGVVLLPEGPMLVVSRPIITSERKGPIRGTLIFGRYLDADQVEQIGKLTHLSILMHRIGDPQTPADFTAVQDSMTKDMPTTVRPLNADTIAGYGLILDVYGNPALIVRAEMPRAIYKQGRTSLRYFLSSLLIAELIFGLVSLLLLERLVLSRLVHLHADVSRVGASRDLSLRVAVPGSDELTGLAGAINGTLEALEVAQQQRRESEERYRSVVEQTSEGIILVDADSMKLVEANHACAELLGYTCEEILNLTLYDILAHDREDVNRSVQSILSEKQRLVGERMYRRKDGTTVDVEVRANLISYGSRKVLCIVIHDITERKQAEKELDSLNKQLQEASRQAGMTEVATGVLHNVGNVLNSVNVSATLVADRVRRSKVAGLTKASDLIRQHPEDLGQFLTEDERGRLLPGYLIGLAENLEDEQASLLAELGSLVSNIEHVKQIVNMQQSYTRVLGVLEQVSIVDLVEDALKINTAAFDRHGVRVVREFEEVPPVVIEKHRLLQILVNLLSNAKYAMSERMPGGKTLTLRIARAAEERFRIEVTDNGVGIPSENMVRIFSHGFTTKKDGHGFGLHSSALTAKEIGGSLTAHSDGPGKGATFILELPLNATEVKH